ncbi:PilX N-terminal domain-containing pilus assembly protein [Reinekea sp.]|jgi:type IV pilus assembly protein PilX|uniref:pilus assembly PilX family protein n=1 Tax=Reinekea sp. TaxID=1970455 RepID=UPI003988FA3F
MNSRQSRVPFYQGQSLRQQAGAVLIVALSLLVILTILGISVMESSVIEERMAGNNLDYNLAFQSAESALRAGEDWISQRTQRPATTNVPTPGVVLGLNSIAADGAAWWQDGGKTNAWWTHATPKVNTFTPNTPAMLDELFQPPRFAIEEYDIVCDGAINDPSATTCKVIYRITARGWGQSPSSTVMLQSLYAKRF